MNKSTLLEPQPRPANHSLRPAVHHTDITRGAVHVGIRNQRVLIESAVQDEYAEPDLALGCNVVGVILRVLAQHLAACPGGGGNDSIEVCLHRREDGRLVEVQIATSAHVARGRSVYCCPGSVTVRWTANMINRIMNELPLACWSFSLVDEEPGPSVGDAAEYIESLGFYPREFAKLELVYEFTRGRVVTAIFVLVGSPERVAELRAAHDKSIHGKPSCTEPAYS